MLDIQHVKKTFQPNTMNEVSLYKDLNLHINKGDFVSVIGSNGSGKSTLFNMICGNVMWDDGAVVFEGEDLKKVSKHTRSRHIARVFQDPSKGTAPSLTILENLSVALNKGKRFGLGRAVSKKDIPFIKEQLELLELGLEDKLDIPVSSLSGGQRQSLSLLMATLNSPDLLLLDEHTAALDPKTSEKIIGLTKQLIEDKGMTAMMVTHNLGHAIAYGNRLIMMHKGAVVMDIQGEEKASLTPKTLIEKFHALQIENDISDEMAFSIS